MSFVYRVERPVQIETTIQVDVDNSITHQVNDIGEKLETISQLVSQNPEIAALASPLISRLQEETQRLDQQVRSEMDRSLTSRDLSRLIYTVDDEQILKTNALTRQVSDLDAAVDRLQQASTAYQTLERLLRAPSAALRLQMGEDVVEQLQARSQGLKDQVFAMDLLTRSFPTRLPALFETRASVTQILEELEQESDPFIALDHIHQTVTQAQQAIERQANPLDPSNKAIDAALFSDRMPLPEASAVGGEVRQPAVIRYVDQIEYTTDLQQVQVRPSLEITQRITGAPPKPEDPPPPPETSLDVHLSIEHDAVGYYRAFIHFEGEDQREKFRIKKKVEEVAESNRRLRESMDLVLSKYATRESHTSRELRADLEELANRGTKTLQKVFEPKTLELLEGFLGGQTTGERVKRVQISAEDFFLPWELLCWPSDGEAVEENFWGFQHNICRTVLDAHRAITKSNLIADRIPDISFLCAPEDAPMQKMLLDWLEKQDAIVLNRLAPLKPGIREQELQVLPLFCQHKSHLLHAGCHAVAAQTDLDAKFIVEKDFDLYLRDFVDRDCMLQGSPLVFLNACNTGVNPRLTADFVRVFLRNLGACGVIATEYDVPEAFAAEFASKFYEYFLTGEKNVGQALFETRMHFLKTRHNPLGLLYSAYVEPETRIQIQQKES